MQETLNGDIYKLSINPTIIPMSILNEDSPTDLGI